MSCGSLPWLKALMERWLITVSYRCFQWCRLFAFHALRQGFHVIFPEGCLSGCLYFPCARSCFPKNSIDCLSSWKSWKNFCCFPYCHTRGKYLRAQSAQAAILRTAHICSGSCLAVHRALPFQHGSLPLKHLCLDLLSIQKLLWRNSRTPLLFSVTQCSWRLKEQFQTWNPAFWKHTVPSGFLLSSQHPDQIYHQFFWCHVLLLILLRLNKKT